MKNLFYAVVALAVLCISLPAMATQEGRTTLKNGFSSNLADGTKITAAQLRSEMGDVADSCFILSTDNSDDLAEGSGNLFFTTARAKAAAVANAINNGTADVAPAQDAVFDALALKIPASYLDTDTSMAANSDVRIATQKATKAYVDAAVASGLADGDKGDITVSSSGSVWTVDSGAISYAKIQNVSGTDKLLGRVSPGAGSIEEIGITDYIQSILDDPDEATLKATLNLEDADIRAAAVENAINNGTTDQAPSEDAVYDALALKADAGANTDITSVLLNQTGLVVQGGDSNALTIKPNETLTDARILNLKVNDADRTVDLSGNLTVPSAATVSGTNTGDQTSVTGNAGTATALAANGSNCSSGQFPLGIDASGAAEGCTALPTSITGTANQITASASTGAITLSTPQDIATGSSPQFAGVNVGNASDTTITRASAGVVAIEGVNAITGSTGSADNKLLRSDGTNTVKMQSTGIDVDDSDRISGFRANVADDSNTSITLQASDTGTTKRTTSNSAVTITLPNSLIVGFTLEVIQSGTGQVTFSAASGATLNNAHSQTKTYGQHAAVRLVVTANSDGSHAVYNLAGDTGT